VRRNTRSIDLKKSDITGKRPLFFRCTTPIGVNAYEFATKKIAEALGANRFSLLVYALFLANELAILLFVSGRIARLARSRAGARVRLPEGA